MTKAELRILYKARRAALTDAERTYLSQQIADQFFADDRLRAALMAPGAVLHTYLPIRRQKEVDTGPIIRRVWTSFPEARVLSSVADPVTRAMPSFELLPDTPLVENRWGIPEPAAPVTLAHDVPTLVLVPLLTFDNRGQRIGYGGGYYDRFLAQLPTDCLRVGLSLFPATEATWVSEETDLPLHGCVQPGGADWL